MAIHRLVLPKMGESVSEATVVKWLKQPGDWVDEDEAVVEIATDKVDSDVPSPVAGVLKEQLFAEDAVVQVGQEMALIEVEGGEEDASQSQTPEESEGFRETVAPVEDIPFVPVENMDAEEATNDLNKGRFYSPLVRSIAAEEGITQSELDTIVGSGSDQRVTKQDVLHYLEQRRTKGASAPVAERSSTVTERSDEPVVKPMAPPVETHVGSESDEIIEMDRMRKLIADHMVRSVQTSPHVCSFVEADVTNLVQWRNRIKEAYEKREGEKITFTPIFIEAVSRAIKDYPMINVSVDGHSIIKKRGIHIGMATELPSGNLIVPVIKNADQLSLVGLSKSVNDLARRARANKLKPDDTQGGTFTLTNVGAFGNIAGTPIINQPQVAILAVGTIVKKPAVLETEHGDVIAIRHKMVLSLSYDHRVVDGSLGGRFIKRVADYLEDWDVDREI